MEYWVYSAGNQLSCELSVYFSGRVNSSVGRCQAKPFLKWVLCRSGLLPIKAELKLQWPAGHYNQSSGGLGCREQKNTSAMEATEILFSYGAEQAQCWLSHLSCSRKMNTNENYSNTPIILLLMY